MAYILTQALDIQRICCKVYNPKTWQILTNKFTMQGLRPVASILFETNWQELDTSKSECLAALKPERILIMRGDRGGELIGTELPQSDRSWIDFESRARNTIIKNNSYLFNSTSERSELNNVTLINSVVFDCRLTNCIVRNCELKNCTLELINVLDKKWNGYKVVGKEKQPEPVKVKIKIEEEHHSRKPDAIILVREEKEIKVSLWVNHRESIENFIHRVQKYFDELSHDDKTLTFSTKLQEEYI